MIYHVTEYGKVVNSKGKVLKSWITNSGYEQVHLYHLGKRKAYNIHRLVATNYCLSDVGCPVVHHIDGNKLNNHFSNLKWVSQNYNVREGYNNGYINPNRALDYDDVIFVRYTDFSNNELADIFNVTRQLIHRVRTYETYRNII